MAVSVGLVAQVIENIAPKYWAEEWDNVGLLVGSGSKPVKRILLCLDCTLEVVEEAKAFDAQLILAHHPIIFKPLKNLRADNGAAQVPLRILQYDIACYAAHTNLDQSNISSSKVLGKLLGLEKIELLERIYDNRDDQLERGYGVYGYLKESHKFGVVWKDFLDKLKKSRVYAQDYELSGVRLAGSLDKEIRKIAIVNGSGGRFVPKALFKGADLLITGDVDHHALLDALDGSLAIADLGHFLSEAPMLQSLYEHLTAEKALQGVEIRVSSVNRSPWL
ncbi:dinuclear metal center protein, YbgI/SA1388 family [Desulfosporosinus orientis DSM 765]|uniref:GTP cyclohydrolase 1 type 2 homolog n=1 Tax=Desulfosporosinus orientis (strain ATCC 19365 / DSM 765 / NCIMB 8382 / VKM B-1628 / Singapore I) TaxID=768706 RepID=G7WJ18_DESOD|nr:Nif3-like dinuclear metal center hexameric protein [Desulfosporosinus orientis]AET70330.1 dinuclear metal center protein, YbgI/SA1388 family [Desulfosporosinus orientis DSM 765]